MDSTKLTNPISCRKINSAIFLCFVQIVDNYSLCSVLKYSGQSSSSTAQGAGLLVHATAETGWNIAQQSSIPEKEESQDISATAASNG